MIDYNIFSYLKTKIEEMEVIAIKSLVSSN